MYTVYILQSEFSGRFYCGQTEHLANRLRQHNDPGYRGSLTTKRFRGPWLMVWKRSLGTRAEALKLERRIKKRGIGRFLDEKRPTDA